MRVCFKLSKSSDNHESSLKNKEIDGEDSKEFLQSYISVTAIPNSNES